jgi:fructose-bisphosphate aldolase class I
LAIEDNAQIVARYATICQTHGLVPIVEPDIDVVNGDHSLEKAAQVSEKVLSTFFKVLNDYGVCLEGIVLKTSMIVPGKKATTIGSTRPEDIAKATVTAFSRTVPPAVPGVAFLSGGQSEEQVTLKSFNGRSPYMAIRWGPVG